MNPHEVEVVVSDTRLGNYWHAREKRQVVVPPLESPLDIGTMLHELGHADQHTEPAYKKIADLYGTHYRIPSGTTIDLETLQKLIDAIPDLEAVFDPATLTALRQDFKELHDTQAGLYQLAEKRMACRDNRAETFRRDISARLPFQSEAVETLFQKNRNNHAEIIAQLKTMGFVFSTEATPISDFISEEDVVDPTLLETIHKILFTTYDRAEDDYSGAFQPQRLNPKTSQYKYSPADHTLRLIFPVEWFPKTGGSKKKNVELVVPFTEQDNQNLLEHQAEIESELQAIKVQIADLKAQHEHVKNRLEAMDARTLTSLPTKILERDATRRAFQWLRRIRNELGIYFFAPLKLPESMVKPQLAKKLKRMARIAKFRQKMKSDSLTCETVMEDGLRHGNEESALEIDIRLALKDAYRSYKAQVSKMRLERKGREFGIVLMAGMTPQKRKDLAHPEKAFRRKSAEQLKRRTE